MEQPAPIRDPGACKGRTSDIEPSHRAPEVPSIGRREEVVLARLTLRAPSSLEGEEGLRSAQTGAAYTPL